MWILTALLLVSTAMAIALVVRVRRQGRELATLQGDLQDRIAAHVALEQRVRELTDADESRSRIFARVSHEIRTPLSGILGVNRMLLQTPLDGRQRELADIIHAQGEILLAMINDILDYSKMEAGRFTLAPAPFSIQRTIDDVARVYGEQARAKHLGFAVDSDAQFPEQVHGDAVRLRQVLDNLLSNAVKFTDTGTVTLRVRRVASGSGSDVMARFEVADTGIGFGAAAARVLFQPFIQDEAAGRSEGGTGLGLAIAKSLVEMMGGEIGCVGEPGKGSTFWFTIRMSAAPTANVDAPLPDTPAAVSPIERGERLVLVAEDNAINRMVTVALLEHAGCKVDVVSNGAEAVAACAGWDYDLVFMDCRMPGMDGYRATEAIRRAEGTRSRVPIVALTAQAVAGEADRCRAAGMDDCVTKPATPDAIARMLDRFPPARERIEPTLVAATLDDLERRSPLVLLTVIEHYLAGVPRDMARLKAAIERGQTEQVQTMAHDLAGSALVVGARPLANLLREAEHAGADRPLDAWFATAEAEHLRVIEALRQRSLLATSANQRSTNTN